MCGLPGRISARAFVGTNPTDEPITSGLPSSTLRRHLEHYPRAIAVRAASGAVEVALLIKDYALLGFHSIGFSAAKRMEDGFLPATVSVRQTEYLPPG